MKRGMVIVETRIIPNFKEVLMNHVKYTGWPLMIWHSTANEAYVKQCSKYLSVEVTFENVDRWFDDGMHESNYNKLLTGYNFWNQLPWDKVLIFQNDSWLLRPGIEQYMQYDFIGAPLYHIDFPAMNGGLSLRDRRAMLEIIKSTPYNSNVGNEDIYFSTRCKEQNLPTYEIATTFSVETCWGWGNFGVHALDKWKSPDECKLILNQYK